MKAFLLSKEDTLKKLNSSVKGLSSSEAEKRLESYGLNKLPEEKRVNILKIFLTQFKSPLIYVLLLAAVVSIVIGHMTDAVFIFAVLMINALIGTFQEFSAWKKSTALKDKVKTVCQVLRDGSKITVESENITLGDIVFLESGSKVPADIRLIEERKLKVDESLLTGESVEVEKDPEAVYHDESIPVADRKNMLFAGSYVAAGRATGVVSDIGENTEVGKIAALLASSESGKSPLITRMEKFSLHLVYIILGVVLLFTVIGMIRGMGLTDLFFFSVALAVAAIPEGLPVAISIALTAGGIAMSKRNVIIRKLASIESLGSCTLIASDKTGTLTKNELTVKHFINPRGANLNWDEIPIQAKQAFYFCNEASAVINDGWEFFGDQVDVALLKFIRENDEKYLQKLYGCRKIDEIPYEPVNGFAAASTEIDKEIYHFAKGSAENILEFCSLNNEDKTSIIHEVDSWAAKGYRTIAFACKKSSADGVDLEKMTFLGFVAIIDPLREGVKEAIQDAFKAGIKVIMITGDHPATAYTIAEELGIVSDFDEVINGYDLAKIEDFEEKKRIVLNKKVFARISPEQKKELVSIFEDAGHFIAVTGDGVNDAPALKYANVGVSMGKSGTDVARESSDVVITDDHFQSIVNGIEEGRIAYDNIRKIIFLLISTGAAEIILVTFSVVFNTPMSLTPLQILWLNLVTNGVQDVALALEKGEPGVLNRKPRSPDEGIFDSIMIRRVLMSGLYMGLVAFGAFYFFYSSGYSVFESRNYALLLMVLFENVHVFNSRSETLQIWKIKLFENKFLVPMVLFAQLVHIASMRIPIMQEVLDVQPVGINTWIVLLLIATGLLVLMEFDKWVARGVSRNA